MSTKNYWPDTHTLHTDTHTDRQTDQVKTIPRNPLRGRGNYDYHFIGSVDCEDSMEPPWRINMDICGRSISFKLDSGADVTVMSEHTYTTLQHPPPLRRVRIKLGTLRGEIVAKGLFIARAVVNDRTFNFWVIVVSGKRDNLLSRAATSTMRLIARLDSIELSDVFGNIGLMKGTTSTNTIERKRHSIQS